MPKISQQEYALKFGALPIQQRGEGNQAYIQKISDLGVEVAGGFEENVYGRDWARNYPTDIQASSIATPQQLAAEQQITSTSITPAADLSKQVATPAYQPPYDISKLGGFAMTPEEISGGQSGIKAYQERIAQLYTPDAYSLTAPESKVQDLATRIQALNEQFTGQSAFRAEQEVSQDVIGKQRTVNDLTAQLRVLQNEAQTIPLQQAGVNVTAGMLGAKQRESLMQNAVKALGISAFLEAARGNLALAYDLVDRAVAAKFDPIREEIAAKMANYDLIIKSPEFNLMERKRAQQLKDIEISKSIELKKQENEQENIFKIGLEAAKNGVDALTLSNIQKAKTKEEALELATKAGAFKEKEKIVKPDLTKLLSVDEAIKFGVPYGTTREQVIGKVPAAMSQLGIEATKTRENAISGLGALKVVEEEINKDMNVLLKAAIPGAIFARKFETARKEASDVITRLRTGAALNESEERFYKSQLPSVLDYKNPEAIKYKIELFRNLFTRLKESSPIQSFQQQNNDPLGIR